MNQVDNNAEDPINLSSTGGLNDEDTKNEQKATKPMSINAAKLQDSIYIAKEDESKSRKQA